MDDDTAAADEGLETAAEDSAEQVAPDAAVPPPETKEERSSIRIRRPGGTWEELKRKRKPSGDPEYDALWELPIGEFEAIADDPDHPQHEKALRVQEELAAPFRETLAATFAPLTDALKRSLVPKIQMSSLHKATETEDFVTSLAERMETYIPEPVSTNGLDVAPNPTYEVLDEQRETNALLGQLIETMATMVDVATADADSARKHAEEQTKLGRHARTASIVAAAIALVVGVASVWVGLAAPAPQVAVIYEPSPEVTP